MSDDALNVLVPALEMAAFERTPEGSFLALTPAPAWFPQLADTTFPFLGYVLDEADAFWRSGRSGIEDWGPSATTNAAGVEFHYMVSAVAAEGRQYLVFRLDRSSDRLREILQKVRDDKLLDARERHPRAVLVTQARATRSEIDGVIGRLVKTSPTPEQHELLENLSSLSATLAAIAEQLS